MAAVTNPARVSPPNEPTMIQNSTVTEFNSQTDTQRTRARKRWDFIKDIATSQTSQSRGFKMGEGVSMSTAEAKFLSMITKNMVENDHEHYVEEHDSPGVDEVLRKVAHDMSKSGDEGESSTKKTGRGTIMFHVVKAAVAKERLRKSIAMRLTDLSGPEIRFLTALVNSEDVTSEQLNNALDILDNDPMYNPSMLQQDEGAVDEGELRHKKSLERQSTLSGINSLDASRNGRRSSVRRKSCVIEASVWKDLDKAQVNQSTNYSQSTRKLDEIMKDAENVAGDKIDEPISFKESQSTSSTKHIRQMSSRAGDAIDPLLSVIPMEESLKKKQKEKDPEATAPKKSSYSIWGPLLCCGMDEVDLKEEEKTADVVEEEIDDLELKKRYLHLEAAASLDHAEQLSTWLGAPEDYPILGLEPVDENGHDPLDPHVLSPLLMKCLRDHMPYALKEENFWLKYSLVRDGASLDVIFKNLRHSMHTVMAIETTEGEVFGSFTGHAWRNNGNNYYGTCDAFVWNLRKKRDESRCQSLDEYILRESTLDVFPWASKNGNRNVQLSNTNKLFVGGGEPDADVLENMERYRDGLDEKKSDEKNAEIEWGMALALDKDLLYGTSSRCATFGSNSLTGRSGENDSDVFEIMNIEIWSLTPCMTVQLAENLEIGRTFVMGQSNIAPKDVHSM